MLDSYVRMSELKETYNLWKCSIDFFVHWHYGLLLFLRLLFIQTIQYTSGHIHSTTAARIYTSYDDNFVQCLFWYYQKEFFLSLAATQNDVNGEITHFHQSCQHILLFGFSFCIVQNCHPASGSPTSHYKCWFFRVQTISFRSIFIWIRSINANYVRANVQSWNEWKVAT